VTQLDSTLVRPGASQFPLTAARLVRYPGNPVITGADISDEHTLVADPFLLVANGRLYAFFEALRDPAPRDGCCGEIWMAESDDGLTWRHHRQVSTGARHFSHPHAFVHEGRVHVFYNNNSRGQIYHRSSPLDGFPSWTGQTEVFRGEAHGWHHLVEFAIVERAGGWHLLGITGDHQVEDRWIRGRWAPSLPADWNTGSREMTPCPLLDLGRHAWVRKIVEITPVTVNDQLYLLMGATRDKDGKRGIGTFAVTELSAEGMAGAWLAEDLTFPMSAEGWDEWDIHRASGVLFRNRWVYAYDGRRSDGLWKIGVATATLD
jgi:hypothetical protein